MYIDGKKISIKEIVKSDDCESINEIIPFGTWGSPQNMKEFEVTWQKRLADLTISALAAIIVGKITIIKAGVATFFASELIQTAFEIGGGYLNAKGTWIRYYTQMYSDWTKYREVWECYWDPRYEQLESTHITERLYGW